jgi:hypothetical protein
MGLLKLYCVVAQQKLVQSPTSTMLAANFSFVSADAVTIEFTALEFAGQPRIPWTVISTGLYTPKLGLFSSAGTQLAFQNVWTPGANNVYTAVLNCNTAAMTAAVSSLNPGSSLTGYLEIKVTDSSSQDTTAIPGTPVSIYKTLITAAAEVEQPGDPSAKVAWVSNTFLKMDAPANEVRIRRTPSGAIFYERFDEDGQVHFERADA